MPHFDLTLNGDPPLQTRSFSVREGISQLFTCEIIAMSHDADIDLEKIVGQPAQLLAVSGTTHVAGQHRSWRGVVSGIEQIRVETLSEKGLSAYSLVIVPSLWLLTQRQGYRIFQHLSVPEIVDAILAEWQIDHAWKLTGSYEKLEYKVQYGESDFAFLSRLLEEAGIAYTFPDHAPVNAGDLTPGFVDVAKNGWSGGSLLTFADDLASGEIYAGSPVTFVDEPNVSAQKEFVSEVQLSHGVRPGVVTIRDHDFRKPAYRLTGKSAPAPSPEQSYEQYAYEPGAFLVEGGAGGDTPVADDKGVTRHLEPVGTSLAARRLAAVRQGKRQVSFTSNVFGLQPAMILTVAQHPQSELDPANKLLVTASQITGGFGMAWSTMATAIFAADGYRPPRVTSKPEVKGVQSATVVGPPGEEIYVDEFGRARVQFPWDREGKDDDNSSCWMRVSQGWAGTGFGALNLPRVGQEVLVGFLAGDPDQPIVVGRVFNATSKVPYVLPDRKSRSTWRSLTYPGGGGFNEIMFEDAAAKELVYHQAQKNRYHHVKNDESLRVDHDRETFVGGDQAEVTEGSRRVLVQGGEDLVVRGVKRELDGGDSHLQVGKDRIAQVGGNDSLVAGKEIHVAAGTAVVIEGAADLTLRGPGGFIRIDATGVTIVGTVVNINSGGVPGVATAPDTPETPATADAGPATRAAEAQLQLGDPTAAPKPTPEAPPTLTPTLASLDVKPDPDETTNRSSGGADAYNAQMMARYEYQRAYTQITGQPPATLPEDTLQEIARAYTQTGPVAARKAAEASVYIEKTGDVPRLRGGGILDGLFSKPKLDNLRKDPDTEMAKSDFMVDPQGYATRTGDATRSEVGGPCTLTEAGTVNGVTRLKVTNDANGKDYYFPWVNRGVGEVNVPKDAPDGTMVVTGGMNGCGLLVTDAGGHYRFYHNADNCRLGTADGCVKPSTGRVVASVEPKDYLGRVDAANVGQRIVEQDPTSGKSYFHQMVVVKNGGAWKVYDSGIIMGPGKAGGMGDPIQSFQQSPTKLLTSFPKAEG